METATEENSKIISSMGLVSTAGRMGTRMKGAGRMGRCTERVLTSFPTRGAPRWEIGRTRRWCMEKVPKVMGRVSKTVLRDF